MFKKIFGIILLTVISSYSFAQDSTGIRIGPYESLRAGINYYNYSEPNMVNIEVSIWGGVKNAGKYLVVRGTKLVDLITLAGGPVREEDLVSVKLIRMRSSGKDEVTMYKMDKIYDKESNAGFENVNPTLNPKDVIIMPITPERSFIDYVQLSGAILAPLVSILTLIITLKK